MVGMKRAKAVLGLKRKKKNCAGWPTLCSAGRSAVTFLHDFLTPVCSISSHGVHVASQATNHIPTNLCQHAIYSMLQREKKNVLARYWRQHGVARYSNDITLLLLAGLSLFSGMRATAGACHRIVKQQLRNCKERLS